MKSGKELFFGKRGLALGSDLLSDCLVIQLNKSVAEPSIDWNR